jgi:hypothetical protein
MITRIIHLIYVRKCIFVCIWLASYTNSFAQNLDNLPAIFSIGGSYHKGFIFAHSADVENTANSFPWGMQLDLNWHKRNQRTWDNCYCYPRTGLMIQYFNYDNTVLGHGLNIAGFIEPYFFAHNKLSLSLKGMAGLGLVDNPFHPLRNPSNMSYSLPVNGFVAAALGTHFRATDRIKFHAYVFYNHISNGGLKDPNRGINWPTASIGFDYSFQPHHLPIREKIKNTNWKNKPLRWETGMYLSSKTIQPGEKRRWLIGGGYVQASKQVSIFNAINAGVELWYDDADAARQKRNNIEGLSSTRAGLFAGNELLMGKFIFSQQLGYFLFNENPNAPALYQRYGLMYHFNNKIATGINVNAQLHVAKFLDFRIAYSFN